MPNPPGLITNRTAKLPGDLKLPPLTPRPLRIFALDPAALTGWCYNDGQHRLYGRVKVTSEADVHPGDRNVRFLDWLTRMLAQHPSDLVAYEEAGFGASNNPHIAAMHAELRGLIKIAACDKGIRCVPLNIGTIKKFATGSGHAKKPQMIAAAERFFGLTGLDDNEADAVFIEALARNNETNLMAKLHAKPKKQRQKTRRTSEPRLF
jgi:Holliday junction resolvasome RuvABC endonuclease subunit